MHHREFAGKALAGGIVFAIGKGVVYDGIRVGENSKVPNSGGIRPATLRGLNGSASIKEKTLTLTVTNLNSGAPVEAEMALHGAVVKETSVMQLAAKDIRAHNSFASPRAIEPQPGRATLKPGGTVQFAFAPASVTRIQMTLA